MWQKRFILMTLAMLILLVVSLVALSMSDRNRAKVPGKKNCKNPMIAALCPSCFENSGAANISDKATHSPVAVIVSTTRPPVSSSTSFTTSGIKPEA
jgi:hypothetical protein